MRGRWWIALNVLVLLVVVLVLVVMLWGFSSRDIVIEKKECVAVNTLESFSYDSCYDAYSETIFLDVKRGRDDYEINSVKISFFDFDAQSYKLDNVPTVGGSVAYKIPAGKNPQNLNIVFDVVKDFSGVVCDEAKRVFVRYCSSEQENVNVSFSPLEGVDAGDYVEVESTGLLDSDVLDPSLVDKERIWESWCKSIWDCKDWEGCADGVQRRECRDVNECFIPTSVPESVRYCGDSCVEDWECEWSGCRDGYTIPSCRDLNSCGTNYDIPEKLECDFSDRCVPEIRCGEWSSCEVDYDFVNLIGEGLRDIDGIKSRVCEDKNSCVGGVKEEKRCSVGVDIYTKRFKRCGVDYVGIYDRLDSDLIAQIEEGKGDDVYLNIQFDREGDDAYCGYCFDGMMDGDETGIDCGGSCVACEEKYVVGDFVVKGWWGRFVDWILD